MKNKHDNKLRPAPRFWASQSGTVAILFALAAIPVLIVAGAGVDYAKALKAHTEIQRAADAASLAGASLKDGSVGQRKLAAKEMFAANLPDWISADVPNPTVVVDEDERTVSVSVTSSVPNSFMRLVGISAIDVNNVSVAIRDEGRRLCMLALDKNESNSIVFNGTSELVAPNCAVQSNSTRTNALSADGSTDAEAEEFCSVGKYTGSGSNFTPAPKGKCARIDDPYANLEAPVYSGCDHTNASFSNGDHTIEPGVFCGGLSLNSHAEVWLEPGIYIIKDGPLSLSAHSTLRGDDVLIYLAGSNTRLNVVSHANIDIKASTSGPYANVAIAQDPSSNPGAVNRLEGGGQLKIDGVVHLPTQALEMAGGGGIGAVSHAWSIIASRLLFTGNAQVHITADEAEANLPKILENPRLLK